MASLSKNRNLTINTLTRHLPENLTQYIIYHELAHAKHGKKHNQTFWNTIRKKTPKPQRTGERSASVLVPNPRNRNRKPKTT
jgi:predicted metal-dependent hydrolase